VKKPLEGFLSKFNAPARRVLKKEGITIIEKLSIYIYSRKIFEFTRN